MGRVGVEGRDGGEIGEVGQPDRAQLNRPAISRPRRPHRNIKDRLIAGLFLLISKQLVPHVPII